MSTNHRMRMRMKSRGCCHAVSTYYTWYTRTSQYGTPDGPPYNGQPSWMPLQASSPFCTAEDPCNMPTAQELTSNHPDSGYWNPIRNPESGHIPPLKIPLIYVQKTRKFQQQWRGGEREVSAFESWKASPWKRLPPLCRRLPVQDVRLDSQSLFSTPLLRSTNISSKCFFFAHFKCGLSSRVFSAAEMQIHENENNSNTTISRVMENE